ncbi:hypothetical protein PMAYCL1PPCAC_17101, partial [Pristionchus mayeri]
VQLSHVDYYRESDEIDESESPREGAHNQNLANQSQHTFHGPCEHVSELIRESTSIRSQTSNNLSRFVFIKECNLLADNRIE